MSPSVTLYVLSPYGKAVSLGAVTTWERKRRAHNTPSDNRGVKEGREKKSKEKTKRQNRQKTHEKKKKERRKKERKKKKEN